MALIIHFIIMMYGIKMTAKNFLNMMIMITTKKEKDYMMTIRIT